MEELFNDFGFDESAEEMNIGIIDGAEKKFPMEEMEEFDSDMIRDFLDSYKNGECGRCLNIKCLAFQTYLFVRIFF